MNFESGIKSISISKEARKVYEELETIRPKHISFSLMLAISADEYIKNHKKGLVKLDEFTSSEVSARTPNFFADIDSWIEYCSMADFDEKKSIQNRLMQIQNIMDGRL